MSATEDIIKAREAGFTDEEIGVWATEQRRTLAESGFTPSEIDAYFGKPAFDPRPLEEYFTLNLEQFKQEGPTPVTGFLDALKAGFGESVTGMLLHGKPKEVVGEDAPRSSRIAGYVGGLVGDIPAMMGGFLAGGGPASPITATGGMMGLPPALRTIFRDKLERGEVADFPDFWDRLSGTFINMAKGWVTGAATAGVGQAVQLAPIMMSNAARTAVTVGVEIPTMVTVGKALEGQMPTTDDFVDAAITLGVMKGVAKGVTVATGKVGKIWEQTGITPKQLISDIETTPSIRAETLSSNIEIPTAYGGKPPVKESPVTPPMAPPAPSLSQAQASILAKVIRDEPDQPRHTLSDLRTSILDNLNPINRSLKEGGKDTLPTSEHPYQLERLTRGVMGQITEFIKYGAYDFKTLKTTTRGYEQILKPVSKDLDGFTAYIVAKRAIELEAKGIASGFDRGMAEEVVRDGAAKYEAVATERLAYKDALLEFLHQGGLLSAEKLAAMREANKAHVPFYRFFSEEESGGTPASSRTLRNPLKRIKGSERAILDPIVSDIKDTALFVALAEKNAARQAWVNLGPEYAVKQAPPVLPMKLTAEELAKLGSDVEEGERAATIFRSMQAPVRKDEMVVYRDGNREVYQVDPKIAEAFQDLDRISSNIITNALLHVPAGLLRAGVILTPEYIGRNLMRDAVSSFLYAGSHPLKTISGFTSVMAKDEAFHKWMKGGGANATMVAIDRDYIQGHLVDLNMKTGAVERAWNVVKSPIELLRTVTEIAENSTRLGAVKDPLMQAKTKATIQALSFIARESTVDFSLHGKNMQEYGKMTAFFNPFLQGTDRFARAINAEPVAVTAKALAAVTLPSLYLWWANRDDQEIQDLPEWEKVVFNHVRVPLPDGKSAILRIPLPQEIGLLFSYMPRKLLEQYVLDNPNALKHMDDAFLQIFTSNMIPTALIPLEEQHSNKSLLSGRPIIPSDVAGLLPEYQYTDYTTETTKAIARLVGMVPGVTDMAMRDTSILSGVARALSTPVLIENYVRAWTGGLGSYILQAADAGLRKAGVVPDPPSPPWTVATMPVLKAFFSRYPGSSQAVKEFYEESKIGQRYWETVKHLASTGDPAAKAFFEQHKEQIGHLTSLEKTISELSSTIRFVTKNPQIPAAEQAQTAEVLAYRMVELARSGNTALANIKTGLMASAAAKPIVKEPRSTAPSSIPQAPKRPSLSLDESTAPAPRRRPQQGVSHVPNID